MKLSERIFGTHSARELKRIMPIVDKIESLRPDMQKLTDEELKGKTKSLKSVWEKARLWTTCCRKPLPLSGRLPNEC